MIIFVPFFVFVGFKTWKLEPIRLFRITETEDEANEWLVLIARHLMPNKM